MGPLRRLQRDHAVNIIFLPSSSTTGQIIFLWKNVFFLHQLSRSWSTAKGPCWYGNSVLGGVICTMWPRSPSSLPLACCAPSNCLRRWPMPQTWVHMLIVLFLFVVLPDYMCLGSYWVCFCITRVFICMGLWMRGSSLPASSGADTRTAFTTEEYRQRRRPRDHLPVVELPGGGRH